MLNNCFLFVWLYFVEYTQKAVAVCSFNQQVQRMSATHGMGNVLLIKHVHEKGLGVL